MVDVTAGEPVRVALFSEINSKFGKPVLGELVAAAGVSVCAVVTSPYGAPLCSYYVDEPDPVDLSVEAGKHGVAVLRPQSVNDPGFVARLRDLAPDYLVIANFQQIFKAALLDVPAVATVNFHPSPLPRYAGLAPFFWMAKNGERDGGVSAVITDAGIDAGPLLAQTLIPLSGTETADQIRTLHFDESYRLVRQILPMLVSRQLRYLPQDPSLRSYFGEPTTDDYAVDWSAGVETVLRTVRAAHPHPGAFALTEEGPAYRIRSAHRAPSSAQTRWAALPGQVHRDRAGGVMVAASDGWVSVDLAVDGSEEVETSTPVDLPARFLPGPHAAARAAFTGFPR